jgi:O-antigen/teichoic acid export membrane protein
MNGVTLLKKLGLLHIASIYVIVNTINAAIPFLITPILTHYMIPAEYGIISLYQTLVGLTLPFIGLNLQVAISRNYFERDRLDYSNFIGNCLLIFIASVSLIGIVFVIFGRNISDSSTFPPEWLWAVLLASTSQFLISIALILWQVNKEPIKYGLFRIFQTSVDIGLTLFLVIGFGLSWQGRIEAQVITAILFAFGAMWVVASRQKVNFTVNSQYVRKALQFGIPLIPHTLSSFVVSMIDRILIAKLLGLSQLGVYSVGYQIGMIIGLVENSFNQAWVPWLFEKLNGGHEKEKIKIVRITYVYFFFIIVLSLIVANVAPWFLDRFFGKEYQAAGYIVTWIALGYAFDGMYKMIVNYIFYIEKTYILSWVTLLSAIFHIAFNITFISEFGVIGAAYATVGTFCLKFIMVWILSSRLYKMPWVESLSLQR